MSKHEDKKEIILLAGMATMKKNGYNGTSVKDIVDAASVPKGSFYNYFSSKEQFAKDAIEYAASELHKHSKSVLGSQSQPPFKRLEAFFNAGISCATDNSFSQGCFLGNMCQEMADVCDNIGSTLDKHLTQQTHLLAAAIKEGQQDKSISCQADPFIISEFLLNAWEGALMRAKASKCRHPLDAFMTMLALILN